MGAYLILGASSDLGCALMKEIAKAQRDAVIYAHYGTNKAGIEKVMQEYPELSVHLYQADLGSEAEVQAMLQKLLQEAKDIAYVVSFAADAYRYKRFSEFDTENVHKNMQIQVYSYAQVLKAVVPAMATRGGCCLFVLSSVLAEGTGYLTEYTLVKGALRGLLTSLSAEYAESQVRFCGVAPSMVETKFVKGIGRKMREMAAELSPLGRNLYPEEVAAEIYSLFATGQQGEVRSLPAKK